MLATLSRDAYKLLRDCLYADSVRDNFFKVFERKMEEKRNHLKESGEHHSFPFVWKKGHILDTLI